MSNPFTGAGETSPGPDSPQSDHPSAEKPRPPKNQADFESLNFEERIYWTNGRPARVSSEFGFTLGRDFQFFKHSLGKERDVYPGEDGVKALVANSTEVEELIRVRINEVRAMFNRARI